MWSDQCETTFQILKEHLTNAPILVVSDPLGDFVVCTDASLEGLGAFLVQDGRVIAYELCKNKDHELSYPSHDLELLAMVHALNGDIFFLGVGLSYIVITVVCSTSSHSQT